MSDEFMLPVGIDSFEKIRNNSFYYVDKTNLIEQLLKDWKEVNLFTRPRRFGKTLNMSMMKSFFETGADPSVFDGLYIANNKMLCDKYMGKYPVIFLSLKGVNGLSYTTARSALCKLISSETRRLSLHLDENKLGRNENKLLNDLLCLEDSDNVLTDSNVMYALKNLSELLFRYYGKKVIILVDEYDVPLDKAFQNGYYKEMVSLIRDFLGNAFKSNDYLEFAVLTGCLRISKESIFTGLNNFKVFSIDDTTYDESFGFTEKEVRKILNDYNLDDHLSEAKKWYDGYRFGNADIYCPWDVINYVDELKHNPDAEPGSYWINSSGNDLVKRFIDKADKKTRDEIEQLLTGKSIEKNVHMELTYDEIDNSIDNVWSVLFTTGYLTQDEKVGRNVFKLKIPNEEVHEVFTCQIQEWFRKNVQNDSNGLVPFWNAFSKGNAKTIEDILTRTMSQIISVLDPKGNEFEKEKFYHAFLSGMLVGNRNWSILSNREAGTGFADLLVETDDPDAGIVIELKSVNSLAQMEEACNKAMEQIHERRYDEYLRNEGRNKIWAYGIAFYKKRCKVKAERL